MYIENKKCALVKGKLINFDPVSINEYALNFIEIYRDTRKYAFDSAHKFKKQTLKLKKYKEQEIKSKLKERLCI